MLQLARASLPVLFAASLLTPLAAQEAVHPERQRVLDEVLRKRTEMREGKIDRYNVRVRVRLKNGAKMQGVVKSGRFIERAEGIEFVESERSDPESGIRIWYFDETSSFIFLRWADIDSHKIVAKLTDAEVKALELEVATRERKRAEDRSAGKDGAAPGEPGSKPAEKDAGKTAKDGKDAKDGKPEAAPASGLLAEFPPADGWSEQKLLDLKRRMVVVGAFPNEKEKRFIDNFDEWKKQADAQPGASTGNNAPQNAGAPPPGAPKPPAAGAPPK